MRIPTLLGLLILLLISAAAVYGALLLQGNQTKPEAVIAPTDLSQTNLSADSVTITWQTSTPTTTQMRVAADSLSTQVLQDLKDNRDESTPEARITHIVTINKLTAAKPIFFKINIANKAFPPDAVKVAPLAQNSNLLNNYGPLVGSVVDANLQPINDALVFLSIENAYPLSTGVNQGGNFILPLNQLNFNGNSPEASISGTLTIQSGNQKSQVYLNLNQISKPLPPIVLGRDFDLR